MSKIGEATYEGAFPPVACGGTVSYFITAQDTEGTVYFDPRAAPGDPFTTLVGHSIIFAANYDFETEVLAASIRHPQHVVQAIMMGCDVATIPLKVIHQLLEHPLTAAGLAKFLADAKKIPSA